MQSTGKRTSAFAVFKAKQDATPKKQSAGASGQKSRTSTPITTFIRQGQGQLKKLRNSARSKKERKSVKRSEGARTRLQQVTMATDDSKLIKFALSSPQLESATEVSQRGSGQKKRKSPYISTPERNGRRKAMQPLQQQEPNAKRLKFQENEDEDSFPGPSSSKSSKLGPADDSLTRDSLQHGKDVLSWMISPVGVDDFFRNLFERKPLFLKRHNKGYFADIFSSEELHNILKENDVQFTRNIDVTTYVDGKRETHNPVGRAQPQVVWDYYKNGCSVRMLNPQSYSTKVWQLLAALQEYFGCFVGANIYMTPPGSQGFAPHYDDIEAFVLQLEGKKHWKLYNQRSTNEVLPRYSSSNFTDADIGQPILDTTLEAGDLLYFPRGVIHQASTPSETHSLHVTISACQKNSWGDLMETLMTRALHVAREENIEFRKSLPTDYLNYMGVAHEDLDDDRRDHFVKKIGDLFSKLFKTAPIDAAVDQMSTGFIHTSLPPVLEEAEESCSIFGSDVSCKNGVISGLIQLDDDTLVRLVRRNVLRLVPEEEKVLVYHSMENSRVYKEKEPQYFEIPSESAPGIEHLIHSYPEYVPVSSLPVLATEDEEGSEQADLAQLLFERGLLVTRRRLEPVTPVGSANSRNKVAIHESL